MTPCADRARDDGEGGGPRRPAWTGVGLLAILIVIAGCAGNPPARTASGSPGPQEHFDRALSARERGDLPDAAAGLRAVREMCAGEPLGDRAFLLLVATRLDPRYRDGPPDSAAAGTARYLTGDPDSRWSREMAESLHLIARDLGGYPGAPVDPVAPRSRAGETNCEVAGAAVAPADSVGQPLPRLSRPSLRGRVRALRGTVDSLKAEVSRLRELLKVPRP